MDTFITGADRERIQSLLPSDEKLLWCGKPELGAMYGLLQVIGGLFVACLGSLPLLVVPAPDVMVIKLIFYIFCSIFIVLGLFVTFVAAPLHISHMQQQLYAITNKRAIVLKHNGKMQEYPLTPYMVKERRQHWQRPADLVLGYEERHSKYGRYMEGVGFLRCSEAEAALRILQERLGGKALLAAKSAAEMRRERNLVDEQKTNPTAE